MIMGKDTKDKWFQAIFTAMPLTSVIMFFMVPLFFVLAPGPPYRMMLGARYIYIVVVSSLIYSSISRVGLVAVKHTNRFQTMC
jgi:hypothetical protein